jgi:hypothetical protein
MIKILTLHKRVAIVSMAFLGLNSARAVTVSLGGNATYIRSNTGQTTQNFGGDAALIVGTTQNSTIYRVLLSFNFSSIPVDAVITSVSLSMTGSSIDSTSLNTPYNLNLYQMTSGFSEGSGFRDGGGAGPVTGSASWDHRGPSSTSWNAAGGDFSNIVLSSVVKNPTTALPAWNFLSTSAFVDAATNSVGGNLSLLLKLEDGAENLSQRRVFFLHSDDATAPENRPSLSVTYTTIPEPSAVIMGLASVSLLAFRRRIS